MTLQYSGSNQTVKWYLLMGSSNCEVSMGYFVIFRKMDLFSEKALFIQIRDGIFPSNRENLEYFVQNMPLIKIITYIFLKSQAIAFLSIVVKITFWPFFLPNFTFFAKQAVFGSKPLFASKFWRLRRPQGSFRLRKCSKIGHLVLCRVLIYIHIITCQCLRS